MVKVFIDGNQGTTGLRINERFSARDDIELIRLPDELRKDASAKREAMAAADVVFLCLPDAAAIESVSLVDDPSTRVIDASTAHRTKEGWSYGFPELSAAHRSNIANGKRVAVPGCHASGFASLVYPLVAGGIIAPDYPIVCHSITGYSGGGKGMIAAYEDAARAEVYSSPRQYGLSQTHKHLPEMQKISGLAASPIFTPIVADYYSGMTVTVPIFSSLMKKKLTKKELHSYFCEYYSGQKLLSVVPLDSDNGGFMGANMLSGKDRMEITIEGNDERILLISHFDNLGKGASGAAVQCMNIMLGLDESLGLVL